MVRPRLFDQDEVLDRAVIEFWRHGYAGLGLEDLLANIGLSRASMYRTFGAKADFYALALDRYRLTEGNNFHECLDEDRPVIDAVAAVFDLIVDQSMDPERPAGCFVVAATAERAPDDERTTGQVSEQVKILCALFEELLDRGRQSGEVAADLDVTRWARFLVSAIQGIRVIATSRPERVVLEDIAATCTEALAFGMRAPSSLATR